MDDRVAGVLAGRQIYWCPGGNGFPAYCPRTTDPDEYIYCCTYGYDWSMPTCCRYPLHTGLIYALCIGAFVASAVLTFLTCWFCPVCPLATRSQQRNSQKVRQRRNKRDIDQDICNPTYFR
uniref:Uncharacterized protein n=1 Tax=Parascaris univalens TaxID=6257 RepID=A0A915AHZ9_PARUN